MAVLSNIFARPNRFARPIIAGLILSATPAGAATTTTLYDSFENAGGYTLADYQAK